MVDHHWKAKTRCKYAGSKKLPKSVVRLIMFSFPMIFYDKLGCWGEITGKATRSITIYWWACTRYLTTCLMKRYLKLCTKRCCRWIPSLAASLQQQHNAIRPIESSKKEVIQNQSGQDGKQQEILMMIKDSHGNYS